MYFLANMLYGGDQIFHSKIILPPHFSIVVFAVYDLGDAWAGQLMIRGDGETQIVYYPLATIFQNDNT